MDKLFVTIAGILGIGFTYWYFLGKREKKAVIVSIDSTGSPQVDIIVEGGYSPDVISVKRGVTTRLNFIRRDPSACLEEIVLSDFKIRKTLPLNQKVAVEITPEKAGTFPFSCGMNMYHGKIIVADFEQD